MPAPGWRDARRAPRGKLLRTASAARGIAARLHFRYLVVSPPASPTCSAAASSCCSAAAAHGAAELTALRAYARRAERALERNRIHRFWCGTWRTLFRRMDGHGRNRSAKALLCVGRASRNMFGAACSSRRCRLPRPSYLPVEPPEVEPVTLLGHTAPGGAQRLLIMRRPTSDRRTCPRGVDRPGLVGRVQVGAVDRIVGQRLAIRASASRYLDGMGGFLCVYIYPMTLSFVFG